MTSPTEQEIVARAIKAKVPYGYGMTDAEAREYANTAISALDQCRAKNAGEVERECAEIIDRNKMYMDGFDGKNELVVGPLNLRWRVEETTDQLSKAANLISSMRAVIEEKDRALELANIAIAEVETEAGLSHGRPSDNFDKGAAAARSFFGDIIRRYRARSTISDGVK